MKFANRILDLIQSLIQPDPLFDEEDEEALQDHRSNGGQKVPFSRPAKWQSGF